MKVNFSELLDSGRVRPLWGRSSAPENALDSLNQIVARAQPGAEPAAPPPADEPPKMMDLADVPIEPPHILFNRLEQALRAELGPRAAMLGHILEPLRVRVHRLDPTAHPADFHPLAHASGGSVLELMHRLEDALIGLRRVASR